MLFKGCDINRYWINPATSYSFSSRSVDHDPLNSIPIYVAMYRQTITPKTGKRWKAIRLVLELNKWTSHYYLFVFYAKLTNHKDALFLLHFTASDFRGQSKFKRKKMVYSANKSWLLLVVLFPSSFKEKNLAFEPFCWLTHRHKHILQKLYWVLY